MLRLLSCHDNRSKLSDLKFPARIPMIFARSLLVVALLAVAQGGVFCDDHVRVQAVGVPAGLRSYAPGRWGVVKSVLENSGDQDAVLTAHVHLKDNPSLRFGREIWIPAHSRRSTLIPVHVPAETKGENSSINFQGRAGTQEFSESARLGLDALSMALLVDDFENFGATDSPEEVEDEAYEVVLALRAAKGLNRRVILPADRLLPRPPKLGRGSGTW